MAQHYDIAVIGAGMAGASLAARLVEDQAGHPVRSGEGIVVLESEDAPGYHTTGRSAAFWMESYGGAALQPLTLASRSELETLGALRARTALTLCRTGQEAALADFARRFDRLGVEMTWLERARIEARVPGLTSQWSAGVLEPSCCDIDVARVHQHYLSTARRCGVEIACRARLISAQRVGLSGAGGHWALMLADGRRMTAGILVNAAGAWADPVAVCAGVRPLGITPFRRTMAQVAVRPARSQALPLVLDLDGTFYFKPEGDGLWLSPHDEVPSAACDAAADKGDIAVAIDRLEKAVDWRVERVERRWAGLRSFAPDRCPVYGFDPDVPSFFWFAGQGGFGIQTAPAAARLGAALLAEREFSENGIDATAFAPSRFGR